MIAAIYARKSTRLGIAIALLLVALGACRASATTIAVYRSETHLVIAADSLTTPKGSGQVPAPYTVCKIFSVGEALFAVGGVLPRTLNLRGDVADILARRSSIQAAADEMTQVLTPKVNSWLLQRGADHVRKYLAKQDDDIIQIVFGAFEGPSPAIVLITFRLVFADPPVVAPVTHWSCSQSAPCASPSKAVIGQSSVAMKHADDLARVGLRPADYAAALVQLEIDAGSPGVGAPIAVAELTSAGVSWPRKGACGSGEGAGNG
ncbi:MAG: hypothetical protein ACREKS_18495 [Candidatus Rokuibacteriota bacterium]